MTGGSWIFAVQREPDSARTRQPRRFDAGSRSARRQLYLDRERVGVVIPSPSDVELEPELITQPDIFVVPAQEWGRVMRDGLPIKELLLAIEVLSPTSARHDRVRKRPHYQRHVPAYWIADLDARLVELWEPADERPALMTETLSWHPTGATTAFTLDLPAFFESVFTTD